MIGIVVKQTGLASDEDIDGRGGRLVGSIEQQSISAHHHDDSWLLIQLLETTKRKPPLFPNPKTSLHASFLVFLFSPLFRTRRSILYCQQVRLNRASGKDLRWRWDEDEMRFQLWSVEAAVRGTSVCSNRAAKASGVQNSWKVHKKTEETKNRRMHTSCSIVMNSFFFFVNVKN